MEGFKYNTLDLEWGFDSKMLFFSCALYNNRHYMNCLSNQLFHDKSSELKVYTILKQMKKHSP